MKAELILCQKSDDELQNIENVFSEIEHDSENRISFTVICKILYEENDQRKNTLHLFLVRKIGEKIRGLYLSEIELESEADNKKEESFKNELPNVPVEDCGEYSLEVILDNNMKNTQMTDGNKIYMEGEIIGKIDFRVNG